MSEQTSGPDKPDFKAEVDALVEGAAGLFTNLREIFEKSRDEITRASRLGKTRLDLLQLEKDREHFLRKLGEITLGLMKDGTLAHDSLNEWSDKIKALDERKTQYDAEIAEVAEEQASAQVNEASANDGSPAGTAESTVEEAHADVEPITAKPAPKKKTTAKKPVAKKPAAKKPAAKKPAAKKPKKDL